MLSTFNCCKTSNVSDNQEEYCDRETEAIYNAIQKGTAAIREDEEQQDDKEQNTYDDDDNGDEDIDAFTMLQMFTKKFGTNGAKTVDISYRLRNFLRKNDDSFDTLLHTAALFNKDPRIVDLLMTCCPDLINKHRTGSYKGQTALHITIAKEKMEATKAILMRLRDKQILEVMATGSKFKNNIMMGETVLSVAVLTLNTKLVDLLLEYGAPIDQVNTKGDTVIHTLLKYSGFIPDKIAEVIQMLKHLNDKILKIDQENRKEKDNINGNKDRTENKEKKNVNNDKKRTNKKEKENDNKDAEQSNKKGKEKVNRNKERTNKNENDNNYKERLIEKMWFEENNDLMTPLKLTVSAGQIEIFQAMMKLKNVFYFPSNYDGFYDTRYYDITEIDPATQYQYTTLKYQDTLKKKKFFQTCNRLFSYDRPLSIIEILCTIEWKKTKHFVDTLQIKRLVSRRWKTHKIPFYIFGLIHLMIMILFTTSIYYRKYVINECISSEYDCHTAAMFARVTPWVLVAYSVAVASSEMHRCLVLRELWQPWKHHNNTWYRASLIFFASGLFVDAYFYQWYEDSNDIIFIILITGCWFLFFFLKGNQKFSVYTVLFQKVIMGDLLRFGLIIGIEFTAYSYAMYIVLRGNHDVAEFSNFENTTLTMFSYMLGLKDLSVLDDVKSAQLQRLVTVIYVLFILTTYLLLLNTLIAMMSGTSGDVFDDRTSISNLQRYTVVQFLDVFFSMPCLKKRLINDRPGEIDKEIHRNEVSKFRKNRFYIQIKIDKIGKIEWEKGEKKNLTLKDIKFELLNKHKKSRQGKNAEEKSRKPPSVMVENFERLKESEESIRSNQSDIEELDEKDSVRWLKSLDIEYQA